MKLCESIGRNSPDRSRSAETTPAMSRPAWDSLAAAPESAGIAIGTGSTLPLVMSMRNSARPGAPKHTSMISAAKILRGSNWQLRFIRRPLAFIRYPLVSQDILGAEVDDEIF